MKANELRQHDQSKLKTMLDDLRKEQFQLQMKRGSGQLAKHDQLGKVRRDIARIYTVMTELSQKGDKV